MFLSFEPLPDRPGIEIVDRIERRQCSVLTSDPVEPTETSPDDFYFPVDRGVVVTTDRITFPHTTPVCVRNHAGWMIAELTSGESETFPEDRYSIELSGPVKFYVVAEAPLSVDVTADDVTIEFDGSPDVRIGARSYHEAPAGTVTTTRDPEDVLRAVSYLPSALKTTSCERSYPTLRGHPPTIEIGDAFEAPDALDRPETGVTLELPPTLRSAFVAAPLVYYLGADVAPADAPRLVTDTGFEHPLDDPARGFEGEVERVLKQSFFLDCLTRTEGFYQVDLHERNELEGDLDLDFPELYDRPLVDQLETYLDVPFSLIEPHLPEWKLTAHVELLPRHVETVPFLVNDLAVIRSPEIRDANPSEVRSTALDEFVRRGDFTRSAGTRATTDSPSSPSLIHPEQTDSLEQAWIGEDVPIGASKAMIEAFRNRLDRAPTDGHIDITVVCNDTAMDAERDVVDDVYGSREELPFDVSVHRELTTAELREILRTDIDFLHYIGHIDQQGFECADGMLDAADLEHTGVDAFFLNACTSYRQGVRMIEAGSIAGVVTLQDVINSGAEQVGKTLARLLNRGFPLRAGLHIAKTQSIMGGNYLVVGDGNLDIAQTKSGVPILCQIERNQEDESDYILDYLTHPNSENGMGSLVIPYVNQNSRYFLTSGETKKFKIDTTELFKFLSREQIPIKIRNDIRWSLEIDSDQSL